ncbi:MAG: bifunctional riboflavin kinase/FAD synthetase [Candidatus Melainabacteria bacterium]|nr:bifunctional riboflavin kinase/FAD synthetase [Candidatus Melainabacteria bacterium]
MQILSASSSKLSTKTAVALGMFDGLHLGHRAVIQPALDYAGAQGLKTAVITLENHPRELTRGAAPKLITNLDTRLALFEELGIDYALVLKFDQELMSMSAEDYLEKYLLNILNASFVSTGYDHHFGKDRSGTPKFLETWTKANSIELKVVDAVEQASSTISSSKIRELITEGKITEANAMLGYEFMIISQVLEGDRRGRELGFPTANLKLPEAMVVPLKGVYCGSAEYHGQAYKAVMNIGTRPSFSNSDEVIIEAHLLDFDQDIYDEKIKLRLNQRLRDEVKFNSAEELIKQIKADIELCTN